MIFAGLAIRLILSFNTRVMNSFNFIVYRLMIICFPLFISSCSRASGNNTILLVGCTPGDSLIKSQLGIPAAVLVDFIKWELKLDTSAKKSFSLNIVYGESQPNTLGFKEGGQHKAFQGGFVVTNEKGNPVYELEGTGLQTAIALVKLGPAVYHLLTPEKKLLKGNGGWSYTLSATQPETGENALPVMPAAAAVLQDTALQVIYEGRTPCLDFAREFGLTVNPSCFKLKWKLILSRDPRNLKPSTYVLKRTNSRETDITGKWAIKVGLPMNPHAVVIQLDPDKPRETITLFVGDENVLYFLHKDYRLFTGNENFSFTLNKRL